MRKLRRHGWYTILMLTVATLLLSTDIFFCHVPPPGVDYVITVQPGDTLWQIAAVYGDERRDIRDVIYHIKRQNHLSTADIYPGQVLIIPAEVATERPDKTGLTLFSQRNSK